jgi:hypothetical protein
VNTKQLSKPAHCSGSSGLKTPLKMSSVRRSSSPELISHATRPFMSTISADVVKPKRRSTRFRHFSSSICKMSCVAWILFLSSRTASLASCLRENALYSSGSRGSVCNRALNNFFSMVPIF